MAGWLPHAAESRSFALGPGWLASRGDGAMPAGTKKGELTRAGGGCGQSLSLSTFHSHESRWHHLVQLRRYRVRTGWDTSTTAALLCVITELRGHCQPLIYTQPEDFQVNLLYGKGGAARPLSMNCFAPMGTLAQMNKKPRPPAVGVLGTSMAHRSPQIHKPTCAWRRSWEGWKEENQ